MIENTAVAVADDAAAIHYAAVVHDCPAAVEEDAAATVDKVAAADAAVYFAMEGRSRQIGSTEELEKPN